MQEQSKKEFMTRGKIKDLPREERERRWKQRLGMVGRVGHAAYKALQTHVPKGTAEAVGTLFGRPDLGRKFAQITGIGDYEVKYNSLMRESRIHPMHQASFSDIGTSAVRMQKREVIGHVIGPNDPTKFTKQEFRLQVANQNTFPWLSRAAAMYSEYMIVGMVVSYETTSSNYATELALGELSIGTQYNANTAGYTEITQCQNGAWSTNGNPSESLNHGIECDPALQNSSALYIRNPGAEGPPNLYDHGVVTVATQGLPTVAANKSLGRIVVTYDILLRVPREPRASEDLLTVGHCGIAGKWGAIWPAMTAPIMPGYPIATIGVGYADWLLMPDSPHVPYSPVPGSVAPASRHSGLIGYIAGTATDDGGGTANNNGQNYIVFAKAGQRSVKFNSFGSMPNPSFSFNAVPEHLEIELASRFCTIDASTSTPSGTNAIQYSLLITTVEDNSVLTIKQNVADSTLTCYLDISPRSTM